MLFDEEDSDAFDPNDWSGCLVVGPSMPPEIHSLDGVASSVLDRYERALRMHPDYGLGNLLVFEEEGANEDSPSTFGNAAAFQKAMGLDSEPTVEQALEWKAQTMARARKFAMFFATEGWDPDKRAVLVGRVDAAG